MIFIYYNKHLKIISSVMGEMNNNKFFQIIYFILFDFNVKILVLMIMIKNINNCSIEKPILLKDGSCVSQFCTEDQFKNEDCIIDNEIIKTQWLNNIIWIGDKDFRFVNFAKYSNGDLIIETTSSPDSSKRIFYGLKQNGRIFFEKYNSSFFSMEVKDQITNEENTRDESEVFVVAIKDDEFNEKEYLVNVGKFEQYTELYEFEENKIYQMPSKDFLNITMENIGTSISYKIGNYNYILFGFLFQESEEVYSFYLKQINFTSINITNYNPIKLREYIINDVYGETITCFMTELKYIICFFLKSNRNYLSPCIIALDENLNYKQEYVFNQYLEIDNIFFKCIHWEKEAGIFAFYYLSSRQNLINLYFRYYNNNTNNFYNYFNRIDQITLNEIGKFNESCLLNDIIKLTNNKICLISVSTNKETLYIIIINIIGENKLMPKYYYINIYSLFNYKIFMSLRAINFNNFASVAFSFCQNKNCENDQNDEHYTAFMILSYSNSTDYKLNLEKYLFDNNNIKIENITINLKDNITIENNLFGHTYYGINIKNLINCNEIHLISTLNGTIINNGYILEENEQMKLLFINNEYKAINCRIEYEYIITEPEFEDRNNYAELRDVNYGGEETEEIYNSQKYKYKGRTTNYDIILENDLSTNCRNINCELCIKNNRNYCITCHSDYIIDENDEKNNKICDIEIIQEEEEEEEEEEKEKEEKEEEEEEEEIYNIINKSTQEMENTKESFLEEKEEKEKEEKEEEDKNEEEDLIRERIKETENISEKEKEDELIKGIEENELEKEKFEDLLNEEKENEKINELPDEKESFFENKEKEYEIRKEEENNIENEDKILNEEKEEQYKNQEERSKEEEYFDEWKEIYKNEDYIKEIENEICSLDKILNNECIDTIITSEQIAFIFNKLKNDSLSKDNKDENRIIRTKNVIFQVSSLEYQKLNDNPNISNINFGKCEDILYNKYVKTNNDSIVIIKMDTKNEDLSITYIQYELYNPNTHEKLDLNECENMKVILNVPKDLDIDSLLFYDNLYEEGYNLFDSKDSFYNDICSVYTTQNNTDILLNDRIKDIYYKYGNIALCQANCTFKIFNNITSKAKCDCEVQNNPVETNISKIKFNIDELNNVFLDTLTNSNFKVLLCYKLVFTFNNLFKNIGRIIMTIILVLYFIFFFIYIIKERKKIQTFTKLILKQNFENIIKKVKNMKKKNHKIKKKFKGKNKEKDNKNMPPKKEKKFNYSRYKDERHFKNSKTNSFINSGNDLINSSDKVDKNNLIGSNINIVVIKKYYGKLKKHKCSNEINKLQLMKAKYDKKTLKNKDNKNNNKRGTKTFDKKEINYKNMNDYELNILQYEKALIYDKRTYFQYYWSLLKRKHLILFTFLPANDYNLITLKISIFLLSISLYFTINCFFFNDETMHKVYKDNGKFNIIYQIPQILYSSFISIIVNTLLKLLSLSESELVLIKQQKFTSAAIKKSKQIGERLTIKFILFFIIGNILLLFFWYYISCFCAVYINTQVILIKDTLICFTISMSYPFALNLFPGIFRIPALRAKNKKCMYKLSGIIALI